ncbi:MAG TPA: hypothetical protein VKS81_06450, partial [Bacteroidota bacterium]|nr:hypothetical protein [Bacteroidota bacterium]
VFGIFCLLSLRKLGAFTEDEVLFHYPNFLNFYYHGFQTTFSPTYSAANTPLPYIIAALVAKLFTPSLLLTRLVTAVFSLGAFVVFAYILGERGCPHYLSLVFLFFPYFFLNSFIFYVINYGLFFAVLALIPLLDNSIHRGSISFMAVGGTLCCAILCQQFYLVIPFSILIAGGLTKSDSPFPYAFSMERYTYRSMGLMLIPVLLPFIIFIKWGGLTHPNFARHALSFHMSTVVAILFVAGFYFSPFAVQSIKSFGLKGLTAAIIASAGLVLFFKPEFSDKPGGGVFTGAVHHLIVLSGRVSAYLPTIFMIILVFSGLIVFFELLKSLKDRFEVTLFISSIALAFAYTFNELIGEHHLLGMMAFMFILVLPRIRSGWRLPYVLGMATFGISYFVYSLFFKFGSV